MTYNLDKLPELLAEWKSRSDALHDLLSSLGDAKTLARIAFDNFGFCTDFPTHQNAVNLFDNWTCRLPLDDVSSGGMPLFSPEVDPRPRFVSEAFGDISGFNILELGSFEGAHGYQLSRMGAKSVLGIEASPSSYLKALIAKELTGMNANYLLGDFVKYLECAKINYDLIFACGVLYHMMDPIHLIKLIADRSDRAFFWTIYVSEEQSATWADSFMNENQGYQCKYHRHYYDPQFYSRGHSGVNPYCCRLTKNDILEALRTFGFNDLRIMKDEPESPGGAAFSLVCHRTVKGRA
jgi:Protein of unknown function (DUF1698)